MIAVRTPSAFARPPPMYQVNFSDQAMRERQLLDMLKHRLLAQRELEGEVFGKRLSVCLNARQEWQQRLDFRREL